eukprot:Polyplicarium_translucidae@DN3262_c0_g1_i6.p1
MVAELVGVKCDVSHVEEGGNTAPEFLAKSPMGIMPVLDAPAGSVFGADAAARFFARLRPDLAVCGRTFQEMAEVESWMTASTVHFELHIVALMFAQKEEDADKEKESNAKCTDFLTKLDRHLATRTYVVGERLSAADMHIMAPLAAGLGTALDKGAVLKLRHLVRWAKTICGLPSMKRYVGDVKFDIPQPTKKAGNPLDDLPPSPFVMDEWKRCYSNTKDLYGTAMKWFWEQVDTEGWSLWHMEYEKLEGECTVSFVTSNQLGGFLQRLDGAFRKYSFGVIQILGNEGDYNYSGVWLFRGQDIPGEMREHPSFEYHKFRKMDPVAEKAIIEKYWCEEGSINGLPIVDCKVWK